MTGRRPVRATYRFFEDVDRQLSAERGPNGEPSTADFQTIDLLRIVDRFAEEFDDLPELIRCGLEPGAPRRPWCSTGPSPCHHYAAIVVSGLPNAVLMAFAPSRNV